MHAPVVQLLLGPGIPALLLVAALVSAYLVVRGRRGRGTRAFVVLGFLGVLGTLLGVWAHFIEPRWIARTSVPLVWRGPPLRIVLLSDIHARGGDGDRIEGIVARAATEDPDLVLIAGDFVDGLDAAPDKLLALAPLVRLRARLGVFAVLGNHDSDSGVGDPARREAVVARLIELHVPLLENIHLRLPNGVVVAGLGSYRAGQSDPDEAFAGKNDDAPTIVVVHNFQSLRLPDVKPFDLALAGHTHAGQICVPFTSVCPFLADDMKPYRHGLYRWPAGGQLYVTSGLGTSDIRARLGARPEIVVLDLQHAPRP
ncbi:MAG: Phosphoesterase [Labilithrix sp.]|nr:Phosphoesterase [Labilithrix sp.]